MSQDEITSSKFQGHKAPVLSLAVSDDSLLLSGSEDHTARLWDLREERRRACLCVQSHGEILSVAFAPKQQQQNDEFMSEDLFARDHSVYLSVENCVYEYDLRQASSPIIQQATRDLSPILQSQDEVNQISLTYHTLKAPKTKQKKSKIIPQPKLYLAASDDAGTLRFMEASSTTTSQVLRHDPNAVVPSCAFRPSSQKGGSLEIASGGTDCTIKLWDAFKPKRPISTFSISTPETEAGKPQVCNPPMVHSLGWSHSGELLAAGLGDGNVNIFSIENRNLVQTGLLPDGHDSSVASVLFPSFCKDNERVLFSGGSDGTILCWDIGGNVLGESGFTPSPTNVFSSSLLQSSGTMDEDDALVQQTSALSLDKSRILFGMGNLAKINWMETSTQQASLYVADTTNDITAYTIPLR